MVTPQKNRKTINRSISFTKKQLDYIQEIIKHGNFISISEYIRFLVNMDMKDIPKSEKEMREQLGFIFNMIENKYTSPESIEDGIDHLKKLVKIANPESED